MTNFDQLFKEKAESAHYPYKEVFWKRFAQKAGIKSGASGFKITLFSVAGAGLIGISFYIGLKNNPKTGPSDSDIVNEVTIPCDSFIQQSVMSVDCTAVYMNAQHEAAEMSKHKTEDTHNNTVNELPKANEKVFRKKESEDPNKWRILTIDPDTIKSNY
jgi:hypothetical protein